jgi:hypothetical protein
MRLNLIIGMFVTVCFLAGAGVGESVDLSRNLKISNQAKVLKLTDRGNRRPGQRLLDSTLGGLRAIHTVWAWPEWVNLQRPPLRSVVFQNLISNSSIRYLVLNILLN